MKQIPCRARCQKFPGRDITTLVAHGQACASCGGTGYAFLCEHCNYPMQEKWVAAHRCFRMVAEDVTDPEKTFRELCQMHDLTHMMSDDYRAYSAGAYTLGVIRSYAKTHLSNDTAARIWNEVADTKVSEKYRKQWHWHA